MSTRAQVLPVVGWREWVSLPELCAAPIKAKIDTGARTSSLHAFDLKIIESTDHTQFASFEVHPLQRSSTPRHPVVVPVTGFREVKSSSGHLERRPVIAAQVVLGTQRFQIEITLTARDEMGFRMLLGRTALRRRFVVDPGRSYRQGIPS